MGVRVFQQGSWGFAAMPSRDSNARNAMLKEARRNAEFLAGRNGADEACSLSPSSSGNRDNPIRDGHANCATDADLNDYLRQLDASLKALCGCDVRRNVVLRLLDENKRLETSDRKRVESAGSFAILTITLRLERGGQSVTVRERFGGAGSFERHFGCGEGGARSIVLDPMLEKLRRKAAGRRAEEGMQTVVLAPEVAGVLTHEALGHALEADIVRGGAFTAGKLGRSIASDRVTVVDFAHHANGGLCPVPLFTDDEGNDTVDACLVEHGILKGFLHNKQSSMELGGIAAGNARASTYAGVPLIRMRNTAIMPGTDSAADLIASVDNGYYLEKAGNGQSDTGGEFTFSIVRGREIRNGTLGQAIRDTGITGNAADVLNSIDMVADDLQWCAPTICSKGQSLPVGIGGPTIRCHVRIGGCP